VSLLPGKVGRSAALIGLSRKDFYILNEPYDRQAYFDKVAELRRSLRM
jgi:hypothetical protein